MIRQLIDRYFIRGRLPAFPVPPGMASIEQHLGDQCRRATRFAIAWAAVMAMSAATSTMAATIGVSDATERAGFWLNFGVTLEGTFNGQVAVDYATAIESGDTAESNDFQATSGSLTWWAGSNRTKKIRVLSRRDRNADSDHETFTVRLSNPRGATLSNATAQGQILDRESLISVEGSIRRGNPIFQEGAAQLWLHFNSKSPAPEAVTFTPVIYTRGGASTTPDHVTVSPASTTMYAGRSNANSINVNVARDGVSRNGEVTQYYVNVLSSDRTIADDIRNMRVMRVVDTDPRVSLALAGDVTASEEHNLTYTVNMTPAQMEDVTATWTVDKGSYKYMTDGDIGPQSGTVTISAGETTGSFDVVVIDDDLLETDEQFTVTLSNPSKGGVLAEARTATGTITNNDSIGSSVGFTQTEETQLEEGGRITVCLHVHVNGSHVDDENIGKDIAVRIQTRDGSALANKDYRPVDKRIKFGPGKSVDCFQVDLINDNVLEPTPEIFTVHVTENTGAEARPGVLTIEIYEQDRIIPTMAAVDSARVPEGESFVFEVRTKGSMSPDGRSDGAMLFEPRFTDGVGRASTNDIVSTDPFSIEWPEDQPSPDANGWYKWRFTIDTRQDSLIEGDETFTLIGYDQNLDTRFVTNTLEPITFTIVDDEESATLSISHDRQPNTEGTPKTFKVELSGAIPNEVSGKWRVFVGSGRSAEPEDFPPEPQGTFTIPAGSTETSITVPSAQDELHEGSETYHVELYDVEGVTVAENIAIGRLTDDEEPPTVRIEAGPLVINETDANPREIRLLLTEPYSEHDIVIPWRTRQRTGDDAATEGEDFTATEGTVTITAGNGGARIPGVLATRDDTLEQEIEKFDVEIYNTDSSRVQLGNTRTTLEIRDEGAAVRLAETEVVTREDDGQFTVPFEMTNASPIGFSIIVLVNADTDGEHSATPNEDYTPARQTLVWPAGAKTASVSFDLINDTVDEGTETATIFAFTPVDSPAGLKITVGSGTVIIHDDERPEVTLPALTAAFKGMPTAHNNATFTFEIEFSETLVSSFSYRTLAGGGGHTSVISVTNGAVTGARRLEEGEDRNRRWEITVEPADTGDVAITLPATTDCTATGAICASQERPLSARVTDTVPTTTSAGPFTATFKNVPGEHNGTTPVVFEVALTKEPAPGYSYKTMRDHSLNIRQGTQAFNATVARRLDPPHNRRWEITITPQGTGDLSITLPVTTDCAATGALCTGSTPPQMLSSGAAATIIGPPGLSVADAQAQEGANVTIDFEVTLSRTSASTVMVDYATSSGTATAGEDYTQKSGTLIFAPEETTMTVAVAVIEDTHDDDGETFTLTLSNPTGATIVDGSATGTINNADPMPKGWLARFGRTSAAQVVGLLDNRFDEAARALNQLTLGGRDVLSPYRGKQESNEQRAASGDTASDWTPGEARRSDGGTAQHDDSADATPLARAAWTLLSNRDNLHFDQRQFLSQSSFNLSLADLRTDMSSYSGEDEPIETVRAAPERAGHWSLWGRGALTHFAGQDTGVSLNGDVLTGLLGLDYARGRWLAGMGLSWSDGDGAYRSAAGNGDLDSTLLSVHPYLHYALTERLSVWGVLGYGQGTLQLTPLRTGAPPQAPITTDMSMGMGALGLRGTLYTSATTELALKSDVLWTRTASDATTGLMATAGDTSRVRLLLTGQHQRDMGAGRALTPNMELGVRYDDGDAETGLGMELGAGLRYADPRLGLSMETRARALLAHEDGAYEEWGVGGSLSLDPGRLGRGLALRLDSGWGLNNSGTETLWQRETTAGLAPQYGGTPQGRIRVEMGYGLYVPWTYGMLTPYGGMELAGDSRTVRLGWRFTLGEALTLRLDGERRESAYGKAVHALMLNTMLPW